MRFMVVLFLLLFVPLVGQAEQLMGYVGFRADTLLNLPKWQRVLNELQPQENIAKECDNFPESCYRNKGMKQWRQFIKKSQNLSKKQKLKEVNKFANKYPYITDSNLWGRSDYWATPIEFLANSGDCEDYSIFKYVTLRELGFSADELRLVVVRDNVRDLAHAVLSVNLNNKTYVMDSLFDAVLEQKYVPQYTPYYAVNETSRWTYIPPLAQR